MDDILNAQARDEDDFYKLLGCDELSTTEQINTEFKLKALIAHPDKNPDDPNAAKRFAELQRARDILTDDKRRQEYDFWRRSGIAVPYSSWISMKDAMHTSMHWAVKKKKDLMLEEDPDNLTESPGDSDMNASSCTHTAIPSSCGQSRRFIPASWTREPANDILQKFRNYNL
ncbi:dnaJ homolog subfamily C member 12-like [Acanthaster planci]|uniref:DnaJ homolog subfamily C member 12-like n=1 Tax=Acanthaster planci TaxID=133434 RepID=A0A8B7ZL94_ACAPL|nr:dnaJ homolog subfamily C member 12-like [Acanthaster planci]